MTSIELWEKNFSSLTNGFDISYFYFKINGNDFSNAPIKGNEQFYKLFNIRSKFIALEDLSEYFDKFRSISESSIIKSKIGKLITGESNTFSGFYNIENNFLYSIVKYNYNKISLDDGDYVICTLSDHDIKNVSTDNQSLLSTDRSFGIVRHSLGKENQFLYLNDVVYRILGIRKSNTSFTIDDLLEFISIHSNYSFNELKNRYQRLIDGDLTTYLIEFSIGESQKIYYNIDFKVTHISENKPIAVTGVVQHLSVDSSELESMIAHATNDLLTGLENKYSFYQKIKDNKTTVFHISINNFDLINDSLGFQNGDLYLLSLSNILKEVMNDFNCNAYRIGGDKFALVYSDVLDEEKIINICSNIESLIQEKNNSDEVFLGLSVSIGVATSKNATNPQEQIHIAKEAASQAKIDLFHNFNIANETMIKRVKRDLLIEQKIYKAFDNAEIFPYFQPKYDLNDGSIIGVEALARWNNKDLGYIFPNEFIPVLEKNNMIDKLDMHIAYQGIKKYQKLCESKKIDSSKFKISVNISVITLNKIDVEMSLDNMLKKYGLSFDNLDIEITESLLSHIDNNGLEKLHKLHDLGAQISIDDFSAGQATLKSIANLPFDVLKIDKELLLDQTFNESKHNLYELVVSYAKNRDLKVLAEGAETEEHVSFLRDVGVDYVQGYHYSKPLPYLELLKLF